MSDSFDFIIVGGGAAGCVLANRLSARSATSVLLLEAGRDTPPGAEPKDVRDPYPLSYYNSQYFWPGLKAYPRRRDNSAEVNMSQGRILGGGSSVMGMTALRGTADDYDEWAAVGANGWAWNDVLPYFRKMETDVDFPGPLHGSDGPVPIRRYPQSEWPPLSRAMQGYADHRQIATIADMNGDFRDGFSSAPRSSWPDRRASAAICYLDAAVRRRPNLRIVTGATVKRLCLEERRVSGVLASVDGLDQVFHGGEVIVSAGALQSPAMLMRAGIGPAEELRRHGIAVTADVAGVGANLQNHSLVYFAAHLTRGMEQSPRIRSHFNTCIRYSSHVPGCPPTDMYLSVLSSSAWHALGRRVAAIVPTIMKPASRGKVSLRSAAEDAPPLIEYNYLSDERDVLRLTDCVRRAVDLLFSPEIRPLWQSAYLIRHARKMRELNAYTTLNAARALAVALMLDAFPSLSTRVFARLSDPDAALETLVEDRANLTAQVQASVTGSAHPVGTCRMGPADSPEAVVSPAGRVHKVDGLRVVDASIMPIIPRGNTNLPTTMVAEKISDMILAGA